MKSLQHLALIPTVLIAALLLTPLYAQPDLDDTDERGVEVINQFMQAISNSDFDAAAAAVVPFTHKSLRTRDGSSLDQDTLRFQFKKAHENASFYQVPVVITRVQQLRTTQIGHPSVGTFEKGTERKYWIAKREGAAGLPAPLVVFFPEDGGTPSISYMGSL